MNQSVKMKKTVVKVAEIKPESDKAKRVYRAAQDTIRRLDEIIKQKRSYKEVFLPEAVNLRSRLQDYCERLMFYDAIEYGRKAEELLWRKVFYDVIQVMKHNRKQMRPNSSLESAFRTHLMAANGYYCHLLLKLQSEFTINLDGTVDFFYMPEPLSHRKPHQPRKGEPEAAVKEWALRASHRCLICLGDIARYQQDYDGVRSGVTSQRYYYQALALSPEIGMPHNQLGTLTGSRYYNLDAAYHYMRCLSCTVSFDGAHGNLVRLLEKNRRRYKDLQEHVQHRDLPPEQQRSKDIKRFVVRFLHLVDVLYINDKNYDAKIIQECCQATLQDFNLCMFYQPPHVLHPDQPLNNYIKAEKLDNLDEEMVYKVIVMCMILIHHLQITSNKQVMASIAFSLALFSHVLNHVVIRLQSATYELENPRKIIDLDCINEKEVSTTDAEKKNSKLRRRSSSKSNSDQYTIINEDGEHGEKKRHKFTKRSRRRRVCSSDSSSDDDHRALSGSDSDLSESEKEEKTPPQRDRSDTDSGEDQAYLEEAVESSGTDSDDNLMVSQELRPGFSEAGDGPHPLENAMGVEAFSIGSDPLSLSFSALNNTFKKAENNNNKKVTTQDMNLLLEDFSMEWLSDSANLFHQSLKINMDVVQGKKEVSVPPGFEKTDESLHVHEITEKLANFVIETDTDNSSFPTDTENSTITTESEVDTDTETDHDSVIDKSELEQRRLDRLMIVLSNEELLSSIKTFCDWMRCNPHIIATCAKSSQSLWTRLSVLLNFLPLESDLAKMSVCQSTGVLHMVESAAAQRDWIPTQPLAEDLHLKMFPPLEECQATLVFDTNRRLDLDSHQEAILRVLYLRRFGYFIAKLKSISFSYDREKGMFYGPVQLQSQHDERQAQVKMANAEARRNQLMKDMAQLRLQAEVSQLEGSLVQSSDQPNLPPYLVPDASALCDGLPLIKQLANSARFIIIIPLAVIDVLDVVKKESPGARDTIRWLEAEFQKGNRYVRAQKSHEKTGSQPPKFIKHKDKDALGFWQILDCARYLGQQGGEAETQTLVRVLTSRVMTGANVSIHVKQLALNAPDWGIVIQRMSEFHSQWKDRWKNNHL